MLYEVRSRNEAVENEALLIESGEDSPWRCVYFQNRPYTTAMIWRTDIPEHISVRCTKINWPDKWDDETGKKISLRRAVKAYIEDPQAPGVADGQELVDALWGDDDVYFLPIEDSDQAWLLSLDRWEETVNDALSVGDVVLEMNGTPSTILYIYDGSDGIMYYRTDKGILSDSDLYCRTVLYRRN